MRACVFCGTIDDTVQACPDCGQLTVQHAGRYIQLSKMANGLCSRGRLYREGCLRSIMCGGWTTKIEICDQSKERGSDTGKGCQVHLKTLMGRRRRQLHPMCTAVEVEALTSSQKAQVHQTGREKRQKRKAKPIPPAAYRTRCIEAHVVLCPTFLKAGF